MSPVKYQELHNYLTNSSYPPGISENQKRSLRKNAKRYKNFSDKPSIVIQDSQIVSVLKEIHDDCGHQCYRYTYNLARDRYFWPSMTKTIKEYVEKCDRCCRCEYKLKSPNEPLTPIQVVVEPWLKVGMDLCQPKFPSSGYKYILTVTDYFTKYIEVRALKCRLHRRLQTGYFPYITGKVLLLKLFQIMEGNL